MKNKVMSRSGKDLAVAIALLTATLVLSFSIVNIRAQENRKTVYVVICIDSEMWGGHNPYAGSTDPHPTMDMRAYSRTSPLTVAAVFDSSFRNSHLDSFGNTFKMTWFAEMDYLMDQSNFVWGDGSAAGVSGYTAVRDILVNNWGGEIQTYGDSIEYHHHFMVYDGTWEHYDNGPDEGYPEYQMYALDHMILDRNFYPSTFRSGWLVESPALSNWLEQWMPFDYTPDSGAWYPSHPSGMSRWQTTSVVSWISQSDVNAAFVRARDYGSAICSIYCHDRDNMAVYIAQFQTFLEKAVSDPAYAGVSFKYLSAREAMQRALGFSDSTAPTFTVTSNGETYTITSNEALWQNHPYVALKYSDGTYMHSTATAAGTNTWTVTPLDHIVDEENVAIRARATGRLPVTAATASSYSSGHEPQRAIDGDETTGSYWDSTPGTVPQWLKLDLGSAKTLGSIRTHFWDGDDRYYRYYIDVSNDSVSWSQTVAEKVGKSVTYDYFNPAISARYIRITVTYNSDNSYAHIIEVSPSADSATVTASSYYNGQTPELAIDGIESTTNYWGTNAQIPEGQLPQWLEIDLRSPVSISKITTRFYDGDIRTYTYYIEVSIDGSSWTTIVPSKTGSGSVTDLFPEVTARYVKITITGNTAGKAAHIEEVKIYHVTTTPLPLERIGIAASDLYGNTGVFVKEVNTAQRNLTLNTSPSGVGSPVGQGLYDTGTYASISTDQYVYAAPGARYRFNGWTTADMTKISDPASPSTTVLMDVDKTVTANYALQYQVTFNQIGLDASTAGPVVTVDSSTKTLADLPFSKWVDSGSSVSYSYESGISSTDPGKQFRLNTVTGLNSPVSVTSPTAITGNYLIQYYLTITSTYDTPGGQGWYDAGAFVTATVTSPTNESSGARSRCSGWTGTGSVPVSGAGTSVTFNINASSSLTWNWITQYYLTMATNVGTLNPESGWYDQGSLVFLSATAPSTVDGERYVWLGWAGTGDGNYSGTQNPAQVAMNAPVGETASWRHEFRLTVTTDAGTTTPSAGSHWYEAGAVVNLGASPPSTISGERYVWFGWTGTGDPSYTGMNNSASITMYSTCAETASWKHEYYLTVASPYGTASGEGWYGAGSDAHAILNIETVGGDVGTRHVFTGWSGDASGTGLTSSAIAMNGPKNAFANWKTQYYIDVASAHDSPTPSTWVDAGNDFTAFVTSPTEIVPNDHQWVCTGFSIDGAAYQAGTTYTFTNVQATHTIDFVWQLQLLESTDPTTTISFTGTLGLNGWYVSGVTVTLTARDNVSEVVSTQYSFDGTTWITYAGPFTLSNEGTTTVLYNSTDMAGNVEKTKSQTAKIDKTPPTISGAPTTQANAYEWYNADVTVHFSANDALSGLDTITTDQILTTEGADQSVTGTATDKAGNTASYTVTGINIDKTPPTITGAPTTPSNGYNWYNTSVIVHFTVSDLLSGADIITSDQTLSTEGAAQSVTGVAVDKAGNIAFFTVSGINIDKTPPSIYGATTTPPNRYGWFNASVIVKFTAVDTLSGIADLTPEHVLATEGVGQSVTGSATDKAGNTALYTVMEINIDKTPPAISGAPTTAANIHGWYKTDVVIHFSASDTLSGIDTITPDMTLSTEGVAQSAMGPATDKAGNQASYTVSGINIDKSPPIMGGAPTTSPNAYGWYKSSVTVHFTASDTLSGLETVTSDQILTTDGLDQRVTGTAVDMAGNNASYMVSGINIDKTNPATYLTVGDPKTGTDPTYVSLTTILTLSATDGSSGIDYIEYRFNNTSAWTRYIGSFKAPGKGSYTLYYHSVDKAANSEPTESAVIVVNAATVTYIGDLADQYSDPVNLVARLVDAATRLPISGRTISFKIGTQSKSAVTNSSGVATTSITLTQAAGSHNVSASFSGNATYMSSSDQKPFVINTENATIAYTGDVLVQTSKSINLSATVYDSPDGSWGNLNRTKVTFRIYAAPFTSLSNPFRTVGPITVSSKGTPGIGVASKTTSSLPENSYIIIVSLDASSNQYFSGPTSDPVPLAVYSPTGTRVTGAGWITDPTGSKGNFGFIVRNATSGQVSGSSIYVYRDGDWDYIVTSSSWTGLTFAGNHTYFEGTCTVQRYNPTTGELVTDTEVYQFRVEAWDNTASGQPDVYQIQVTDSKGAVFHEAGFNPFGYIQGGNIIV